jgi:hypothetical protein
LLASTRRYCLLLPSRRVFRENNTYANKPLMACTGHWKSFTVLPMFRTHPMASDPGNPGARP